MRKYVSPILDAHDQHLNNFLPDFDLCTECFIDLPAADLCFRNHNVEHVTIRTALLIFDGHLFWLMLEGKEYLERIRETLFYSQKRPSNTQDTSTKLDGDMKETKAPAESNEPQTSAEHDSKMSSSNDEVTTVADAETLTQPPIPALEMSSSKNESTSVEPGDETVTPIEPAQAGEGNQTDTFLELDIPSTQVLMGPSLSGTDDKPATPTAPIQATKLGEISIDPRPKMNSNVLKGWKCGRCSKSVQDEETLRRCFGHSCRGMHNLPSIFNQRNTQHRYNPH